MKKFIFSICLGFIAIFATSDMHANTAKLLDGDIIFQRSQSRQSSAIAAATGSQYTHMGIIFVESGQPWVYEAVSTVKKCRLADWINRGKGGKYTICRLKDDSSLDRTLLKKEVSRYLNRKYDLHFDWSDSKIYCSELVWKAYKNGCGVEVGDLKQLRDFDLSHQAVRALMSQRYGNQIPYQMKVIAPVDMYRSKLLKTVASQ